MRLVKVPRNRSGAGVIGVTLNARSMPRESGGGAVGAKSGAVDPRALVRPLEAAWESVLDEVLRAAKEPAKASGDVAKLGPRIAELSRAYNAGEAEGRRTKLPIDARIAPTASFDTPRS